MPVTDPELHDYSRPTTARRRTVPVLTWTMAGLCILFTLAYWTAGHSSSRIWQAIGAFGAQPAAAIWSGQYHSLLTAVFVHGGWLHLVFDMMWLVALGSALEETLHPLAWLAFFVGAGVAGAGAELALSGQTGIGASGVVYGMFGLMWAGRRQVPRWRIIATRQNLNLLVGWGIFCFVATVFHIMRIANAAHAGGFLFGLAVGWLFFARCRRALAVASLAGLAGLTVLAATWMPWSGDWTEFKGDRALLRGRPAAAAAWYGRSLRRGQNPDHVLLKMAEAQKQQGDYAGASATINRWIAHRLKEQSEARRAAARPAPTAPDQLDGQ